MITSVILSSLILLGIFIGFELTYTENKYVANFLTAFVAFILFVHILCISLASYSYESFAERGKVIQKTLNHIRKQDNDLESIMLIESVMEWNIELAKSKYNNSTLFFDQYIDDRIEKLEPIK